VRKVFWWILRGGPAPGRTRQSLRNLRDALQDAQLEAQAEAQVVARRGEAPMEHAFTRGKLDGLRTATRLLDLALCTVEDVDRPRSSESEES